MRFLASAPLVDLGALLRILVLALALGAGVVSAFSLGLVGVSEYTTHRTKARGYVGIALAMVCFAIGVAAIGLGLFVMLARKG